MERVAIAAFVNNVMGPLFRMIQERSSMLISVRHDSDSLRGNLSLLAASMDDQANRLARVHNPTAVARLYDNRLRELMHDVEDCIERFLHRVSCAEGASPARLLGSFLLTIRTRYRFGDEIRALNKRLEELNETRRAVVEEAIMNGVPMNPPQRPDHEHVADPNPVGIERAMGELLGMLDEKSPVELRVIAIVGFAGSGKTTLARAVYSCPEVERRFPYRAWVHRAMHNDAREILETLLINLSDEEVQSGLCVQSLAGQLKACLSGKRYLIVIDDMGSGQWNAIKCTFEDNSTGSSQQGKEVNCGGSRIIVTTAMRSEANSCCSNGNGYIYQMQNFGHQDCKRLALGEGPSDELQEHSTELLKKCDGHPLSLVCVANYLRDQNEPTGQHCDRICPRLGSQILDNPNFTRLRGAIMDSYINLSNEAVRTCLLYLGIFPNDVPLQRTVIIRRWLAEGYARSENVSRDLSVAHANFEALVNRGILHPIFNICKNGEVKKCKSRGIVQEFVLHKSKRENFIMSFGDDEDHRGRHLSIDHRDGANGTSISGMDLSCVRSLTIFGSAGDAISMFKKYKILRVLDLENCKDVKNKHLKHICKLWNLRYLSLGAGITVIPKSVAKLKLLETLCLGKTNVKLPVQVFGLPCLVHLIGKFQIQDDGFSTSELIRLSNTSKLETLSGFVADESQEFFSVLGNMRKLRKVKIWCVTAEDGSILPAELSLAIQMYINTGYPHRSLSIHVQGFSRKFRMSSLAVRAPCYLSSLKVKFHGGGRNTISPDVFSSFTALTEVCLSLTVLTQDLLTSLGGLKFLLYVKLIAADSNEKLAVQNGAFPSLRRLCIEGPLLLKALTIEEGALQKLVSLQLLCRYVEGLAGIEIKHLVSLGEVTLDSNVRPKTKSIWEEVASRHPNRPKILYDSHHENF